MKDFKKGTFVHLTYHDIQKAQSLPFDRSITGCILARWPVFTMTSSWVYLLYRQPNRDYIALSGNLGILQLECKNLLKIRSSC